MPEELDGIQLPIDADLAGLEKGLKDAEKIAKKAEQEAAKRLKQRRSKERKAVADRLREFRAQQSQFTASEKKNLKMRLNSIRQFEKQRIAIASKTARTITKNEIAEAKKALKARQKAAGREQLVAGGAKIAAGAVGIKAVISGFDAAIEKSKEFETALTGLGAIAKTNQETVSASVDKVKEAAIELAKDGTLSLNDAAQSLKLLISQGKSLEQSFKLTKAVKQIAALENISGDAGQATQDFFKSVLTNSQDLLENASPSFRKLAKEVGGFTKVTEDQTAQQEFYNKVIERSTKLNESYKDSLQTTAAVEKQFTQQLDTFLASVGDSIAPALNTLKQFIGGLLESFTKFFNGLSDSSKQILVFGAAIAAAVPAILSLVSGLKTVFAALKALGFASTLSLGPLGLFLGAVAAITAAVVALNEAFQETEGEKFARELKEVRKEIDKAADDTDDLTDALRRQAKILEKIPERYRAILQAKLAATGEIDDRTLDVIKEAEKLKTPQQVQAALDKNLSEQRKGNNTLLQRGKIQDVLGRGIQDQVQDTSKLLSLSDSVLMSEKERNAVVADTTENVKRDTDLLRIQEKILRDRLSQLKIAKDKLPDFTPGRTGVGGSLDKQREILEDNLFITGEWVKGLREIEDETRKSIMLAKEQKGLIREVGESEEDFKIRIEKANKELEESAKRIAEIKGELLKTSFALDQVNEGLGGAADLANGIRDDSIPGILGGIGGIAEALPGAIAPVIGGIIAGIGETVGLLQEIFGIESREEQLARRREEIAKAIETLEQRRVDILKVQESLGMTLLRIAKEQRAIALEELDARKEINAVFGEGTVRERKQDLRQTEKTLEEIGTDQRLAGIDFTTREGQLRAVEIETETAEKLAAVTEAQELITTLSSRIRNIPTPQLVRVSRRLGNLSNQAGGLDKGKIDDFRGDIANVINSRAAVKQLQRQRAAEVEELKGISGKDRAAQQIQQQVIDQLDRLILGEQERLQERKGTLRTGIEEGAFLVTEIQRSEDLIEAINQGTQLGQEAFELDRSIREQRQEERLAMLTDMVEDTNRLQEVQPEQAKELQNELINSLREKIVPQLAGENNEDLAQILADEINKRGEGFQKDRLQILADQLKVQEEISASNTAIATELADFTGERSQGVIDISRGLIRDLGGTFGLQASGVNFGVPESVGNLSQTLASAVSQGTKSIPEQQLDVLKMIKEGIDNLVGFAENADSSLDTAEAQKFLLNMLSEIQLAQVS